MSREVTVVVTCDMCGKEIKLDDIPVCVFVQDEPSDEEGIVCAEKRFEFHPSCWVNRGFHLGNILVRRGWRR